ncbi:hypothetical protein BGW39_005104 [Mortierella sp. 14UC]|nr:hypothetical protein BGW39_005104 [Mortierella sp. 14UC]
MFLPWSFFFLNFFYLILDLLVAASFAAALAHIARRHGGYAQSIRWIQQAGHLEMFTALKGSWGNVDHKPLLGLLGTLAASFVLIAILVGSKLFAEITTQEGIVRQEVVASKQVVIYDITTMLPAWYIPIDYGSSMEEALAVAINGTRSIPQASPTKRYSPRRSEYEIVCDRFDFRAHKEEPFLVPNNGCATVRFNSTSSIRPDLARSHIVQKSNGRAKVVMYGAARFDVVDAAVSDISVHSLVTYNNQTCIIYDSQPEFISASKVGITSSPTTILTKCLLNSGETVILSSTTIRFIAPQHQQFHSIATSMFGDQDELVSGMQDSINDGTLTNLPADIREQVLVMEMKTAGTEVTALICEASRWGQTNVPHIMCAYIVTSVLIAKFQPMNPDIAALLTNKGLNPKVAIITKVMHLYHLPKVSKNKPSFPFPQILNASFAATRYFASLGHNFVLDWDGSMLYVTFDTVEIVKGYEIPAGLFYSMVAVMIASAIFSIATEVLVEGRFNRSLYFAVSKELAAGQDGIAPRLHRFNPDTLEFEGRRIVSTEKAQVPEKEIEEGEEKSVVFRQ